MIAYVAPAPGEMLRRYNLALLRVSFKTTTHEMAQRFCATDCYQSLAIVAEVVADGVAKLVGVARLLANPSHRKAEYAVLVEDAWQGRGLGSLLTRCCFDLCMDWGVVDISAATTTDNLRMQRILQKQGLVLERIAGSELIYRKRADSSLVPS